MKRWVVKWKPSKTESCNPLCEEVMKLVLCANKFNRYTGKSLYTPNKQRFHNTKTRLVKHNTDKIERPIQCHSDAIFKFKEWSINC